MFCERCHTFRGTPLCPSCRTLARIARDIQSGKLSFLHEGLVLSRLRDLAGLVNDLIEEGGPSSLITEEPPAEGQRVGEETAVEVPKEAAEPGALEEKEVEKEKEEVQKSKKDKKKAKVKKSKAKKEKSSGAKEAPGSPLEVKEDLPKETEQKEKKEKEAEEDKSPAVVEVERQEEEKQTEEERRQEALDKRVSENPSKYHLGRLPVRGTAASHLEKSLRERGPVLRPAEPEHPPRSHGESPRRERQARERSRSRRRGTKGRWHGQRGFDRGYTPRWPEKWRQK